MDVALTAAVNSSLVYPRILEDARMRRREAMPWAVTIV